MGLITREYLEQVVREDPKIKKDAFIERAINYLLGQMPPVGAGGFENMLNGQAGLDSFKLKGSNSLMNDEMIEIQDRMEVQLDLFFRAEVNMPEPSPRRAFLEAFPGQENLSLGEKYAKMNGNTEFANVVHEALDRLGEVPDAQKLLSMDDETLVGSYTEIFHFARMARSADAVLQIEGLRLQEEDRKKLEMLREQQELLAITEQRMELLSSPFSLLIPPEQILSDRHSAERAGWLEENAESVVELNNGQDALQEEYLPADDRSVVSEQDPLEMSVDGNAEEYLPSDDMSVTSGQDLLEMSPAGSGMVTREQIHALARYCRTADEVSRGMAKGLLSVVRKDVESAREKNYISPVAPGNARWFTAAGDLIRDARGNPATLQDPAVLAELKSGRPVVASQGGKSTVFELRRSGTAMQLDKGEPNLETARNQMKNINAKALDDLVAMLDKGDSVFLLFTASQEYKNLQNKARAFRKAFRDRKENEDFSAEERKDLADKMQELFNAGKEYLVYKNNQRNGDLSGKGRRYEATRINAVKGILEFAEVAAAQVGSYNGCLVAAEVERNRPLPAKDMVAGNIIGYYARLASINEKHGSDRSPIHLLAGEIKDKADVLGEYAAEADLSAAPEKMKEFRDLLAKMVAVDLLLKEKGAQELGELQGEAVFAQQCRQNKEGFLRSIAESLPKDLSHISITELATGGHAQQIRGISSAVQENLSKQVGQEKGEGLQEPGLQNQKQKGQPEKQGNGTFVAP